MTEERVLQQLQLINDDIRHNNDKISTIQNWCMTVWLATLALVNSPQPKFNFFQRGVLPLLPIIVFWLLTGIQKMLVLFQEQRAVLLERALAEGQAHLRPAEKVVFHLSYQYISFSQKFRFFLTALFFRELVTTFYGLLAVATTVLLLISQ